MADVTASNALMLSDLGRLMRADSTLWFGSTRVSGANKVRRITSVYRHGRILGDSTLQCLLEAVAQDAGGPRRDARCGEIWIAPLQRPLHAPDGDNLRGPLLPDGLAHGLTASLRVAPGCAAHLLLARRKGARAFSARDIDLLYLFMAGTMHWHREQLLCGGWIEADKPLTARQRDVLSRLLSDATEPEIAASLGLTPRTTHQYATEIFRRFGVSGRRGLMALFLRYREPPAPRPG